MHSISPGTDSPLSERRARPFSRDVSPDSERWLGHYRETPTRRPRDRYPFSEGWVPLLRRTGALFLRSGAPSRGTVYIPRFRGPRVPLFRGAAAPRVRGTGDPTREGRFALLRGTGAPFPIDGYPMFEARGAPRPEARLPWSVRRPAFSRDGYPDAEDRVPFFRGPGALCRVRGTASSEGQRGPPFPRDGFPLSGGRGFPSNECRLHTPIPRCG